LIDDIELDNDQPPYDYDEMPGGDTVADAPWSQEVGFANSDAGMMGHIGGFAAECGLVKIQVISAIGQIDAAFTNFGNAANSDCAIFIHLVPGPYRGVLAERMGQ